MSSRPAEPPILTDLPERLTRWAEVHKTFRSAGFSRRRLPNEFCVSKSVRIVGSQTAPSKSVEKQGVFRCNVPLNFWRVFPAPVFESIL